MMFLCAAAAAAALPVSPAGAATQVGAGAALLIVSGIGRTEAVGFALAAQTLIILAGAGALFLSVAWDTPAGPSIVLVLAALFTFSIVPSVLRR